MDGILDNPKILGKTTWWASKIPSKKNEKDLDKQAQAMEKMKEDMKQFFGGLPDDSIFNLYDWVGTYCGKRGYDAWSDMILDVYVDDVKTRRAKFLDALKKHVFAEDSDGRKLAASTKKDVKEFGLAYEKFQTVYLGVKAAYEEVTSNQTIDAMKHVCSASESVQGKLKTVVGRIKGALDAEKEKVEKGVFEKLDVLLDSANRWKLVTDDYEKAISRIGMGRNFLGKDASLPHETMGWPFSNKKVVKDDSPIDAEKACAELTEQFKYLVNDTAWPKDLEEFVGKLEEFKSHVVENLLNRSKRFADLDDAAHDVYWTLFYRRSDVIPMVQRADTKRNANYNTLSKIKSELANMIDDIYKKFPDADEDRKKWDEKAKKDRSGRRDDW